MRKLILALVAAAAFFVPATAHAQSSSGFDQELVQSYEVEHRTEGERYYVTPTDEARSIGSSGALSLDPAYELTVKGIPATETVINQLICHVAFAGSKETWNLEAWRPVTDIVGYISSECNP